ncbi:DUF4199 domain-containing protein [Thermoflavifilum thermophilum]|uniref:DUF4199 domain-containing protein n=1 Tax=Thermoflavifilum thermophilum TaxID=1393122 RepID=A0A1I7N0J7_9BACT|nr:DUF4199 domain-containing protein [Thermoflavifilum thermophilum]SFV28174.1 Protein of unknown function [Thermoflavifilum thermophilum]
MEQSPQVPATPKTHLQWGILIAVIMIVLFVVYYVFAVPQQGFARWIPTLLFVVLIILAQQAYGKAMAHRVTYGELFANGFKTTAVTTSLYVLFLILFLIFVPGFKEQSLNMAREAMEKKGNMTEDQINMAMSFTAKYFTVFMLAGTIFGTLIAGAIASLIGAAIARKEGKSAPPAS